MARLPRPSRPPRWATLLSVPLAVLFTASTAAFVVIDARIATDAAFFQHVGWAVTKGVVPYVDVWDINPPITFAVTALLALLTGGNLVAQHALGVAVMFASVGGGVLLTGWVAREVTGDDAAAVAAGLVMLVPPEVYGLPPWGVRSQYLALVCGVAGLALALRDRPFSAGAATALAAGAWQPGVLLALVVTGMATRRGGRRAALRAVAGGLLVAALVVLPFAAVGALGPMVVETVVAPLVAQLPYSPIARIYEVALALGYGALLVPVALFGWVRAATGPGDRWWIPAAGGLYTGQMLFLNMDGALDALLWLVFVALGVAVAVHRLPARRLWAVVGVVGLLVLSGLVWHLAPAAPLREPLETQRDRAQPPQEPPLAGEVESVPWIQTIYWQKRRPDTCHYRLSWTEFEWLDRTEAQLADETCGRWPE